MTTDNHSTPLNTGQTTAPEVLVDADACPVKEEIYKVAGRHGVPVTLVANCYMRFPRGGLIRLQVVDDSFDAADDWIAEAAHPQSVVITADILLAQRCLDAGASVLAPTGKPFTDASIGSAVATRGIMADLRASVGTKRDGPGPVLQSRPIALSGGPARGARTTPAQPLRTAAKASDSPRKSKEKPPPSCKDGGCCSVLLRPRTYFGMSETTPPPMLSPGVKAAE